jgi:hypothetical protein
MKSIDLGKKCELGCPVSEAPKQDEPEMHYPSLFIEGGPELKDLPKEGTMTVKFKRASIEERTSRDGKTRRTLTLDILSIEDVSEAEPEKENREAILDKLAEEDDE